MLVDYFRQVCIENPTFKYVGQESYKVKQAEKENERLKNGMGLGVNWLCRVTSIESNDMCRWDCC